MTPSGPSGRAGLYLHFPFCFRKCPYCHFFSQTLTRTGLETWFEGMEREAKRYAEPAGRDFPGAPAEFDTLYLGGGTPSLMTPEDLRRLIGILSGHLELKATEFTLESNPGGETGPEILRGWRRAGVSRLSVGAQSFDDGVLKILGRDSTAARAESFLRTAREADFRSLGLDLMIGVPGETSAALDRTIDAVRRIEPDHVSLYFLENVDGLPFEEILRSNPVDDDAAVEAFERAAAALASLGLRRYEISNFARPGHECLHNLKYWRYEPFLGLGPSAASHLGSARWTNVASFDGWAERLAAGGDPRDEIVVLDRETEAREALASGLRLVEGIDRAAFAARFGFDPAKRFPREIAGLEHEGLIDSSGGRLRIPEGKLLVSNAAISRLI
jgi:oxygen-independent coproporphyrinogen III oxidase